MFTKPIMLKLLRISSILFILAGAILVLNNLNRTIDIDYLGKREQITSNRIFVAGVLSDLDIPLYESDVVYPSPDTMARDNLKITISRPIGVHIYTNDEVIKITTYERRVANILALAGIKLFPGDVISDANNNQYPIDYVLKGPAHFASVIYHQSTLVNLHDKDIKVAFRTTASTLKEALDENEVSLAAHDTIEPSLNTRLDGKKLDAEIKRAKQFQVNVMDKTISGYVTASTAGEAMVQMGIPIQGADFIETSEDTDPDELSASTVILHRVDEDVQITQIPMPFSVQYQPIADLEIDQYSVVQPGEYGIQAQRVRSIYVDNELTDKITEAQWVAKEPKPRIVGYGTKIVIRTLNTPDGPIQYWRAVQAYASSYSPCRSGVPNKCYPNTSSGKPVQKGVIAVTIEWYRYMKGMSVYIPGYGFATIEDVGAGLPDRHWVDLGYSDEDWVGWGQYVTVYFLAPAPSPDNIMWILE